MPLKMTLQVCQIDLRSARVNIGILNQKGSLFVTRPSLNGYADTRERLEAMSEELFAMIESGKITIDIAQRFALADAAKAQKDADDHSRMVHPDRPVKMRTYYDSCEVEEHEVEE